MSFSELNYYYIRNEIQGKLGKLPLDERLEVYDLSYRAQSLKRMREAYSEIIGYPDKLRFYKEAIVALGEFEADFIVWSIYHECEADALISQLEDDLVQLQQILGCRASGILQLMARTELTHDGSRLKGCLKSFFVDVVEVSESQWVLEDERTNPVINQFLNHIFSKLSSDLPDLEEIRLLILHYNRLWMLYYARPFSYLKGNLLLDKINKCYAEINPLDCKVDLIATFTTAAEFSRGLLPPLDDTPFFDLIKSEQEMIQEAMTQLKIVQNYWSRIRELSVKLKMDQVFLQDLSKWSLVELITHMANSTERSSGAYRNELEKRKELGLVPSTISLLELSKLGPMTDGLSSVSMEIILNELIECNYVFFGEKG